MADEQYKVRSGPNGPLYFPATKSDAEIDKIMKDQAETIKNLPKIEATGGDKPGGKIPPVEPTGQMPAGPMREIGIAGGQFARGAASPIAIPGDVVNIARTAVAMPPDMFPQTRKLPTTQSLDRAFTNLGITPPYLAPQGFWENELAGAARGAGEATSFLAPRVPGYAAYPFVGSNRFSRYGSLPTNLATGTAAGGASTATEQLLNPMMDPDKSSTIAPLAPAAAGTVAGLVVGGGIQGAGSLYRSMTGTTPYHGVVNALGGNISTGEPFINDAGGDLRSELIRTVKAARAAKSPVGAGGVPGTDLDKSTYNALAAKGADGSTLYNRILNDPQAAITLRNEYPDEMDNLAGAHLANTNTRAGWLGLHPRVQESLIPDPGQRGIVNQTFRGGVVPGNFLENLGTQASRLERNIALGVGSEAFGAVGHYFAEMAHSDPSLAGGLALLGAVIPPAWMAVRGAMGSPTARQGLLGTAVGLGPGTELISPNMQYQAPSDFNPPQSQSQ